jgi:hypothetical protein
MQWMEMMKKVNDWLYKRKAFKWANVNSAPPKGSPWWVPMAKGMIMTSFS